MHNGLYIGRHSLHHILQPLYTHTPTNWNLESMLGLRSPVPLPSPVTPFKSKPLPPISPLLNPNFPILSIFPQISRPKRSRIYAQNGNGDKNKELPKDNGGEAEKAKNGRPRLNLRWADLVLDPNPDNIVAVGLTGLLTWASVQVLWQLFVISAAIVLAALKYSIVAALLIFILITLLWFSLFPLLFSWEVLSPFLFLPWIILILHLCIDNSQQCN